MTNTLITPTPIRVQRAIIYTKATAVTVSTSATLVSLFTASTDIYNKAKNITITPPTMEVVQENMLGETTSSLAPTQTFQNYVITEKPQTMAKISGTVLLDCDEDNLDLMYMGAGTATVTGSYHAYQVGGSDSSKKRVQGAILVLFKSGTKIREVLLNSIFITKLGDIKATGSDGHLERDFEGECHAENYVDSRKD